MSRLDDFIGLVIDLDRERMVRLRFEAELHSLRVAQVKLFCQLVEAETARDVALRMIGQLVLQKLQLEDQLLALQCKRPAVRRLKVGSSKLNVERSGVSAP
jgi:hypothetical protein